jgi:hypothetical protein
MSWKMVLLMLASQSIGTGLSFGTYEYIKAKRAKPAGFKSGFAAGALAGLVLGGVAVTMIKVSGAQIPGYSAATSLKGIPMATANRLMGGCAGCGY